MLDLPLGALLAALLPRPVAYLLVRRLVGHVDEPTFAARVVSASRGHVEACCWRVGRGRRAGGEMEGGRCSYPAAGTMSTSANHPRRSLQRRSMAKPPWSASVASMASSYL